MDDTPSSLTKLILTHFDAHQRGGCESHVKKGRRSPRGSTATPLGSSVEARASTLRAEISSFLFNHAVEEMSMNDSDNSNKEESARTEIVAAMLNVLNVAMTTEVTNESQESSERVIDLAACFSSHPTYAYLADALVARTAELSGVLGERVRSQACKLLGLSVGYLRKQCRDEDWKDECIEVAKEHLLSRLTDKSQSVRNVTIQACASFFVGDDDSGADNGPYDDVEQALLWSMAHDPSLANRSAAIQSTPLSQGDTLDHIIARVHDVKAKVRVEALEVLRTKANFHSLNQEQMAELVRSGLTDRCQSTFQATTKMICTAWMKAVKFDPVALVELIGPVIYEAECEKMVLTILDVAEDDSETLSELSDPEKRAFQNSVSQACSLFREPRKEGANLLDSAQVLFARVKCEQAEKMSEVKRAQIVSKIVPDIPALCEMLLEHLAHLVESIKGREDNEEKSATQEAEDLEDAICFVCIQLLQLAKTADLQEEGSRRHFVTVMKGVLASIDTPDDLLEGCIRAMSSAHDTESQFLQTVSEILSELSESTDEEGGNASLEDIQVCQHLRIVSILSFVLENTSAKMATSPILQNFSCHIIPAVTSQNAMVRECGVSSLGRYALLSKEENVIDEVKPLLLQVAGNEEERLEIRGQAALAFCDLALLFSSMLEPYDIDNETVSFISIITGMLNHSKPAIMAIAAEVTAKLLFAGKLYDSRLVAQLLSVFFHADFSDLSLFDEGDGVKEVGSVVRLQQLLTVFFPAYSMKSKERREALMGSIGPLLDIIYDKQSQKKKGVNSATWPIVKMIEYVCSIVDMGNQQETMDKVKIGESGETNEEAVPTEEGKESKEATEETSTVLHASVAVSQFLVKHSSNVSVTNLRGLCKFLGAACIDIDADAWSNLAILKKNVGELELLVTDATSLRAVHRIYEVLTPVESDSDDEEDTDSDTDTDESEERNNETLTDALNAITLNNDKENEEETEELGKETEEELPSSRERVHLMSVN